MSSEIKFIDNIAYICDLLNLYKIKYTSHVNAQCKTILVSSTNLSSEDLAILDNLSFKYIGNDTYSKTFNMSYKFMHANKI